MPSPYLAIIPARGGSKGVPRKNIRLVAGKPLIAWTIEAAQRSAFGVRVIVSTDDEEIASVAREYGAEVPFLRPSELAHDRSLDIDFLRHALQWLDEHESYRPEIILRLPPTSPLRTAAHIDEGIKTLLANPEADACRPIMEAPKHPYKMWKIAESGNYIESFLPESFTHLHEPHNMPRQALPKVYIHTGAMDVMRYATITEQHSTSGKNTAFFFMKEADSVNIDTLLDLEFADFLLQKQQS